MPVFIQFYLLFVYGIFFAADPIGRAVYKAWVCGRSLAGIVGSNPAGGMDDDVCVVFVV
jgi:hypothetical protein